MRGKSIRPKAPALGILSNNSTMTMVVVLIVAMASVADIGHAQIFNKTKMLNGKGREIPVDLCFDQQSKLLTVKPYKSPIAEVPYGVIDKLSYGQAAHRRIMDGGPANIGCIGTPAVYLTCPASFGVAAVLMFTKGKNHWFYVDYKQDGGSKELALKLDKSEYEQVLKSAHEQTGKDVEILVPQKGKTPGKK